MKVLLLGVGMQGKAALHDLVNSEQVTEIVAADQDIDSLRSFVKNGQYEGKVNCEHLDAADATRINQLMSQGVDVAIDLLPVAYIGDVVQAAVKHGAHLVNTNYVVPEMKELANEAYGRGITILPEFGLDPGIDLVMLNEAVRSLDDVKEIYSYGAGIPEPDAADNAIKYKVTWTFEGVLGSYYRTGYVIQDGKIIEITPDKVFEPENIHEVEIEGLGKLEAYPNGDPRKFADLLGIDISGIRTMGRYTLRWPGHCDFWKTIVDLHLLDDEPLVFDGKAIDRKRFLAAAIEPHIQLKSNERDLAILRIEVIGEKGNQTSRAIYQLVDRRDLITGFTAMSRTVGFTASIGAIMIGTGLITKRGLLAPVNDIPYNMLINELGKRDIQITTQFMTL
jgi:saccharopine dehydrogenase-like NADP-dependent oxidoreductase